VGSYRAVIGPDIRDPFGNEMDQNNNGITGEIPGDQYVVNFSVFGPRIIASTPNGVTGAPVSDIFVTFNEPMDASTFDPNQVVLSGPNGPITVNDVTPVAGSNNTKFDIAFDPQSSLGAYQAVIGPDIRDPFGNEMDQNNNGITGEIPGDQFVATFMIVQIINYQAQAAPQSFIQLAGDPNAFTIITTANFSSVAVNLGSNTFTFYNGAYTGNSQLFVSTKGLITFGSSNISNVNTNLTTSPTQAAIAPLWSDWIGSNVNSMSNPMVLGEFTTFNGAPALVVEWNQVWHYLSSPQTISFEAILMLNTGTTQGDIYFEYANLDTGDGNRNGATATVGIKDSGSQPLTGGNLLLVNFNSGNNPLVQSNTAIHLSVASAGPDVEAQFDDPFAVPLVLPVKAVLTDGNQGDDGAGGGNGGDVGIGAPLVGPSVAGAPRVAGGWDQGATPADAARGTLIDVAIADGDADAPGLSLAGLTRPGRRRST
jgi:hypothetical protein